MSLPPPLIPTHSAQQRVQVRNGTAITFQDWTGGEFGIMDAGLAGRASKQMWTGKNVMVYNTGLIGPRPGLKKITITSMVTGTLQGMDVAVPTSGTGPWFWIAKANSFYLVDVGAGTVSSAYTGAGPTMSYPLPNGGAYGPGTLINAKGQGMYTLDHNAKTVAAIASSPHGNCIGFYKTRFVANDDDSHNGDSRMYFSGVFPGWATWSTTNYYDIGSAYANTLMRPFRDGLLIGKESGEMWYLTGVLGTQANLRKLSNGGAPLFEPRGLALDNNICWYFGYAKNYPASFNGAVHTDYKHLQFMGSSITDDTTTPNVRLLPLPWLGTDDWMAISGQAGSASAKRMLLFTEGVFTYHTFDVTVDAWAVAVAANIGTSLGQAGSYIIIADGAGGNYYKFAPGLDRPAFTSDTSAQPGDNSTTPFDAYFQTPEWWDDQGNEVRIQKVIVDYESWATGSATANGFTVQADMLHRYGDAATTSGAAVAATGVPAGVTTAGTKMRAVVSADASWGYGGGFQVKIGAICGCAIRSVTVVLSEETRRP